MPKKKPERPRPDAYQIVTDRILELLEQGVVPWRRAWRTPGAPRNLHSVRAYRGVNVFMLACLGAMAGHTSSWWLTFRQALERGGNVRKGERGLPVVFWKVREIEREDPETGETETGALPPVLRYYTVFNAEQCDGIEAPAVQALEAVAFQPHERCEAIVQHMPRPHLRRPSSRGRNSWPLQNFRGAHKIAATADRVEPLLPAAAFARQ